MGQPSIHFLPSDIGRKAVDMTTERRLQSVGVQQCRPLGHYSACGRLSTSLWSLPVTRHGCIMTALMGA